MSNYNYFGGPAEKGMAIAEQVEKHSATYVHQDAVNKGYVKDVNLFDAAAKSAVQGVGVAMFLKWLFGRRG